MRCARRKVNVIFGFSLPPGKWYLYKKITDNGGGYRPDSRNQGTGTGMRIIMQTIRILNNKNNKGH